MNYLLALVALIGLYALYEYLRISPLLTLSKKLVAQAKPYQRGAGMSSMLVLGDSTAVGVGAPAEATVAARLSALLDASVESYAKSGAVTADIAAQLAHARRPRYDLILIQVGANDVIRFHNVDATDRLLNHVLRDAAQKSDHVVMLTAGKVGQAPFFPFALRILVTRRAAQLRAGFLHTTRSHKVAYVDLFTAADPFGTDPQRYYAPDFLHLSADGYGFWFDETRKVIQQHWPALLAHE